MRMKAFAINEQKTKKNERAEERIIKYFSSYEKAQAYLQEYAENMGYDIKRNEDGIITGAIFDNKKRSVFIVLTIEAIEIY